MSTQSARDASRSTSAVADRDCPICLVHVESAKMLQNHVALHLERLALFSLPRSVDGIEVDDEKIESDNANAGDHDLNGSNDSRKDDFTDTEQSSLSGSGEPDPTTEDFPRTLKIRSESIGEDQPPDLRDRLSRTSDPLRRDEQDDAAPPLPANVASKPTGRFRNLFSRASSILKGAEPPAVGSGGEILQLVFVRYDTDSRR